MADCNLTDNIAAIRQLIDQLRHLEHHLCELMGPTGRLLLVPNDIDPAKFKVIHLSAKAEGLKKFEGCRQWRWGENITGFGINVVKLMGKSRVVWHGKQKSITLVRGTMDIEELYRVIDTLAFQYSNCVMATRQQVYKKLNSLDRPDTNSASGSDAISISRKHRKRRNDAVAAAPATSTAADCYASPPLLRKYDNDDDDNDVVATTTTTTTTAAAADCYASPPLRSKYDDDDDDEDDDDDDDSDDDNVDESSDSEARQMKQDETREDDPPTHDDSYSPVDDTVKILKELTNKYINQFDDSIL